MVVLLLLGSLAAASPTIVPLSDRDGTPGVAASFDVDAPSAVVLDLLWDVSRFQRIFPDIKSLQVVGGTPPVVDVRFDVDAVIAAPTYTLRRTLDTPAGEIRWVSIAGDIKRIAGRWIVRAAGPNRAHVTYESFVDVGVPGVSTVYRDLVKARLVQMAERVRRAAAEATAATTTPSADTPLPAMNEGS